MSETETETRDVLAELDYAIDRDMAGKTVLLRRARDRIKAQDEEIAALRKRPTLDEATTWEIKARADALEDVAYLLEQNPNAEVHDLLAVIRQWKNKCHE